MSTRALVLAIAGVIAAGCATPPPGRPVTMRPPANLAEPVPEFERLGEIQFTPAGTVGASAAWDRRSVRGPAVNLTLTDEGLWGGTLRDRAVLVLARGGRITGEGVDLFVTQDGPVLHVQGMWFGSLVRVDLGSATLSASPAAGICGIELGLAPDGLWRGFGGCGGALESIWMNLKGLAADPSAEMPQWIFAFLAILPSAQVSTLAVRGTPVIDGAGLAWFLPAEFRGGRLARTHLALLEVRHPPVRPAGLRHGHVEGPLVPGRRGAGLGASRVARCGWPPPGRGRPAPAGRRSGSRRRPGEAAAGAVRASRTSPGRSAR